MCTCSRPRFDASPWRESINAFVWRHRDSLRAALGLAVAVAGLTALAAYHFSPTDIDRAESDLQRARAVVADLDEECATRQEEATNHKARAAHYRQRADQYADTADAEWLEWNRAMADSHAQLHRAKRDRRDNLLHLVAVHLRLLAEAECEILRARDARDRGTPYEVAPRVRDLLAPILNTK